MHLLLANFTAFLFPLLYRQVVNWNYCHHRFFEDALGLNPSWSSTCLLLPLPNFVPLDFHYNSNGLLVFYSPTRLCSSPVFSLLLKWADCFLPFFSARRLGDCFDRFILSEQPLCTNGNIAPPLFCLLWWGKIIAPLFDCSSVCLLVFYSSIRLCSSPVFPSFKMSWRLSSFLLEEEIWWLFCPFPLPEQPFVH